MKPRHALARLLPRHKIATGWGWARPWWRVVACTLAGFIIGGLLGTAGKAMIFACGAVFGAAVIGWVSGGARLR
jgi:hypothetical protein